MTKKTLITTAGETVDVNIEQIVFVHKEADNLYFCRLAPGDNISFTTDPFA